jgi:endoglucanase
MVTLRHQGKQCNSRYTAGGVAEDNATKAWFRQFADTIGNARVVIGYEPDSIGTIECLARHRRAARRAVLAYGVDVLSKLPNATIYLEGTASDWKSPAFAARELKAIGVAKVRGFMLNVTHYDWTITNIRFGNRISKRLGGKPFVVNTSYNGRGAVHYKSGKRKINVYCNPQYRGIGPKPTTNTGHPKVDAFLYINRPGLSGVGGCNGAPPKAGTWWPARALMFGRWATEWVGPRKGTRHGLPFRISLCKLGAPVRPPSTYSKVAPSKRCRR